MTTGNAPKTLFDKVWDSHVVAEGDNGECLLYVDRHFVHEGSFHAFDALWREGWTVRRPDRTFAVADHYVPSRKRALPIADPEVEMVIGLLEKNAERAGITHFGLSDPRQGIVHLAGPEQGLTQPGLVMVCGDSHTSTHGAFGALAFGIGASEVKHVLASQTIWQVRPKTMRITVSGARPKGVTAKDIILTIIGRIGAAGASGHVIEYAGDTIAGLSMDERMTICNMSIEAGGRAGMIAPDETTFDYMRGRPYAPDESQWDTAVVRWRALASDPGAVFDHEVDIDASEIVPTVTWGTSPEDALPITARVPDPATMTDAGRKASVERALAYMGLTPGMQLSDVPIDRVFIGSCTNSRLSDLRAAAEIVRGRRTVVPAMVVPGSAAVKLAAETEGLDQVFKEAGFEWLDAGCSMCIGMNGDRLAEGERCASTTNRNFEGRQGRGGRTHLVSPAMAAAAAVTGRLTDVRTLTDPTPVTAEPRSH